MTRLQALLSDVYSRFRPAASYRVVRWLFPRLLAGIYVIAFLSWEVQLDGLCGEEGILPTGRLMENIQKYEEVEETSLFWSYPSLYHWQYSDALAHGLCWAGVCLSLLVIAGVLQGPLLLALWFGYLSIASTGEIFMGYQWDALLLEAGLLAVLLAPWRWWTWRLPARHSSPPKGSVFLLHFLLFRLMFLSGYVKIAGGDNVWEDMSALRYHFETQPLPNMLAWWMHQLPDWALAWSCRGMYGIELLLPFAIFLGRWGRMSACAGFSLLMVAIFATGNYNFFNLLTVALALALLDDSWWPQSLKRRLVKESRGEAEPRWHWRHWPAMLVAGPALLLSLLAADGFLAGRIPGWKAKLPVEWQASLYAPVQGLRSFNAYGLFQDMTEERPEIVIEVSDDGYRWLELEFPWKPGDLKRRPGQVAPHQPRLDWQMWFAALYPGFQPNRDAQPGSPLFWFGEFLGGLAQGKQPVWDLMEPPPMPMDDIREIRAVLYQYRFTDMATRLQTGEWWTREWKGGYSPIFKITPPAQREAAAESGQDAP
ncbi:lipase maturation factor family protein [Prosthecobacter sp. SYSU 5D2]|uniref:lipase maturation factor family protein n=1 Tax=Prosthecobacter sp. SYSU 5D2 TaxID=3134134 RepID=UPI0031FF3EC9